MSLRSQLREALDEIEKTVAATGCHLGAECERNAAPILQWVHWYETARSGSCALELLSGCRAAVLETIAYVGFGLGRAAVTSIRTQIDTLLSFSFFRNHPAEWNQVTATGRGFRLRGDVVEYHKDIDKGFEGRLAQVEAASGKRLIDVYRKLSAHIHGQSTMALPKAMDIKTLVWDESQLQSVVEIQSDAALTLGNFLAAVHATEWQELPAQIVTEIKALIPESKRSSFFNG
jgi:hypothetical protein